MDPALAHGTPTKSSVVFQDGLGERRRAADVSGAETIEMLCLRDDLTAIPSFEFALRERTSRLANFRHTSFARVRSVDRLSDPSATLAILSDSTKGVRLSNLLAATERRPLTLDVNASLHLIRQLVASVALLHESARDTAHGALGPERIIVTPNARVVITEYVLGAALEQLHFTHEQYWRDLRIALPASPGLPRFDHRADVLQVGLVALSLLLGRPLKEEEFPGRLDEALAAARAISAKGGIEPLPNGLRNWLARALQMDARHSFATALEARDELDRVLSGEDEEEIAAPVAATPVVPPAAPTVVEPPKAVEAALPAWIPPTVTPPPAPMAAALTPLSTPRPAAAGVTPLSTPRPQALVEEFEETEVAAVKPSSSRGRGRIAAAAVAIIALSTAGVFAGRRYLMAGAGPAATGMLSISSSPAGAQVVVDGQPNGVTPVALTLKAGAHVVELRGAGEPRTVPVTITAGTQVSQYIELPKAVTAFGLLQVRTDPPGAQVTVDGVPRGKSPVLVESLAAGEHTVQLESDSANVKQTVSVEAGATASLVVPLTAGESASVSGWVSVSAPAELQLKENGRLLGTSQSDRLMVTAGKHEIEMTNDVLGYRAVRTVQVPAGKVAPIKVEWPKGSIAINALPWAEVWIDGEKIGETPIGNLSLPIGGHEILFRHPDLGEQKYAATVSLKAQARVSVDLRKK